MKKSNKKGFTIVELVIVIAVIAILAAVLIPTFSGVVEKANQSKALQEAKAAYTVYLADILSDNDSSNDKVGKIYIEYEANKLYVVIEDGKAEIAKTAPTGEGVTQMYVSSNGAGDKTLSKDRPTD